MTLSVLHISDLHRDPQNPIGNRVLLDSLERDRDHYVTAEEPAILPPNLVIVSGDIVQGVRHGTKDAESILARQYDEALDFLNRLTESFVDGNKQRVVIVPGNHDVSDDCFRRSLTPVSVEEGRRKAVVAELYRPNSRLRWSWDEFAPYEIADMHLYNDRLAAFARFYEEFYDGARTYSTEPSRQLDIFDMPDDDICIVGFCSCYNNDLLNRQGAIHPDCIAEAGSIFREINRLREPLRMAVWHHNTEGPPVHTDYMDPDIVQNLIDAGFSLGFHGHQHRPEYLDTRFRHGVDRSITLISAGTLCGGAAFGHRRAYNLIEIDTASRSGRLFLREMQNDNLHMPIWGARPLPPNRTSYTRFEFPSPPKPFVGTNKNTNMLTKAQDLFDSGQYTEAARIFESVSKSDQLGRKLYLECLLKLGDTREITARFDPPASSGEAIALMDALWAEGERQRLAELLAIPVIAQSKDGAVVETHKKYAARLKR